MSSSAFTPSTTTVTNNVPVNVPVVTAWEAYTPTFEGFGTPTSVSALWRRVGDNIQVTGNFTSGTPTSAIATISLPSGLNLDSTKINGPGQTKILGFVMRANSTSTPFPANTRGPFVITESKNTSTSKVYLSFTANTLSGGAFEVNAGTNILASGELLTFEFNAPISQWSSGTTTLADRAVEEYASNSNATTSLNTSDTTSFAYGPSGSLIPNASLTTGNTIRRVRFETPILPTDKITLEYLDSSTGSAWQDAAAQFPQTAAGTGRYGALFSNVNSTDVDVYFLSSGYFQNNATYGGAGATWASLYTNNTRWRVRKVSSGAAVGFPVSARNIVGDTSGSVVPVGMLGEQLSSSATITAGTASPTTITSLTLSTGTWLISAVDANLGSSTQTGSDVYLFVKGSNSGTDGVDKLYFRFNAGNSGSCTFASRVVNIASADADKTIQVRVQSLIANAAHAAHIVAVRIA